jgi:hypothetical protein
MARRHTVRSPLIAFKPLGLALLAVLVLGTVSCTTYEAWRYPCLSREQGLRGEVMRRADGTYLYFNGECWTTRFVTPTDTPF